MLGGRGAVNALEVWPHLATRRSPSSIDSLAAGPDSREVPRHLDAETCVQDRLSFLEERLKALDKFDTPSSPARHSPAPASSTATRSGAPANDGPTRTGRGTGDFLGPGFAQRMEAARSESMRAFGGFPQGGTAAGGGGSVELAAGTGFGAPPLDSNAG